MNAAEEKQFSTADLLLTAAKVGNHANNLRLKKLDRHVKNAD